MAKSIAAHAMEARQGLRRDLRTTVADRRHDAGGEVAGTGKARIVELF
jgi:hypothetical protein